VTGCRADILKGGDVSVTEKAEIVVVEGRAEEFESVLPKALPLVREADGCTGATIGRGVEYPNTFLLLIEWSSREAHTAFTGTSEFSEFVGLIKEFFAASPGTVHYAPLSV
jgi:quinol monooxygenase YgiN